MLRSRDCIDDQIPGTEHTQRVLAADQVVQMRVQTLPAARLYALTPASSAGEIMACQSCWVARSDQT